jgi:hypothetical protein
VIEVGIGKVAVDALHTLVEKLAIYVVGGAVAKVNDKRTTESFGYIMPLLEKVADARTEQGHRKGFSQIGVGAYVVAVDAVVVGLSGRKKQYWQVTGFDIAFDATCQL